MQVSKYLLYYYFFDLCIFFPKNFFELFYNKSNQPSFPWEFHKRPLHNRNDEKVHVKILSCRAREI